MIKQAKDLQVGEVIYVIYHDQRKEVLTIASVNKIKMPMGFPSRFIYGFKGHDFHIIFRANQSIPVIGKSL